MKLELDVWQELWDRAGSRGLDNWHELPETAEAESGPEQNIVASVSEAKDGG